MNVFNSSTLLIGEGRGGGEGKFTILSIRFSQLEAKREMHFRMPFCFGILRSPSYNNDSNANEISFTRIPKFVCQLKGSVHSTDK
ncbi:hypothetical protein BLOT_012939 [Blomia tropicalis]|nr:hypothetical protein BLOT_012939 [Blomia tropicalis]